MHAEATVPSGGIVVNRLIRQDKDVRPHSPCCCLCSLDNRCQDQQQPMAHRPCQAELVLSGRLIIWGRSRGGDLVVVCLWSVCLWWVCVPLMCASVFLWGDICNLSLPSHLTHFFKCWPFLVLRLSLSASGLPISPILPWPTQQQREIWVEDLGGGKTHPLKQLLLYEKVRTKISDLIFN